MIKQQVTDNESINIIIAKHVMGWAHFISNEMFILDPNTQKYHYCGYNVISANAEYWHPSTDLNHAWEALRAMNFAISRHTCGGISKGSPKSLSLYTTGNSIMIDMMTGPGGGEDIWIDGDRPAFAICMAITMRLAMDGKIDFLPEHESEKYIAEIEKEILSGYYQNLGDS